MYYQYQNVGEQLKININNSGRIYMQIKDHFNPFNPTDLQIYIGLNTKQREVNLYEHSYLFMKIHNIKSAKYQKGETTKFIYL